MATFSFWSPVTQFSIPTAGGSGVGFFGGSFGSSIKVGEYQQTTWVSSSDGVTAGAQMNNIKWLNIGSGTVGSATSGIPLTAMANKDVTLQVRFNHTSNVKTQNVKLWGYDRVNQNNSPSGVTFKSAQTIHVDNVQTNNGSGSTTWTTLSGSGSTLSVTSSPGLSGYYINGPSTSDQNHDFFFALSVSPDSIGSKTFALMLELEYL